MKRLHIIGFGACVGILFPLLMAITEPATSAQHNDSMLYVVTYVDVRLNSLTQGAALVKRYREAALSEKGNSSVNVVQESGRPNRFVIIEIWKDDASFKAHEQAPDLERRRGRPDRVAADGTSFSVAGRGLARWGRRAAGERSRTAGCNGVASGFRKSRAIGGGHAWLGSQIRQK